jgi:hypothetical protein
MLPRRSARQELDEVAMVYEVVEDRAQLLRLHRAAHAQDILACDLGLLRPEDLPQDELRSLGLVSTVQSTERTPRMLEEEATDLDGLLHGHERELDVLRDLADDDGVLGAVEEGRDPRGLPRERLAETGVPSIVHSVIETLDHLLPTNPQCAFTLIGRAIASGKADGYQYDSLAVDLMVKVVRRFLAEHRALLQQDAALRDVLLDVLDVFVQVGWPQAQDITYGLHDIFR